MNKIVVFSLVLAVVASIAYAQSLACDRQMGVKFCLQRNGECFEKQKEDESEAEYFYRNCKCIVALGNCLDHVECNGTTMWSAMAMCTKGNCDNNPDAGGKCLFHASAYTVYPTILVALLSVLFLFM